MHAVELRHGFTYGRAVELAWGAVGKDPYTRSMDLGDRFEAAWGAAVECLYAAAAPPTTDDLRYAAQAGLTRLRRAELRERGFAYGKNGARDPLAGPGSAVGFRCYWHSPLPPTPEDIVVSRTALRQILPTLSGPAGAGAAGASGPRRP